MIDTPEKIQGYRLIVLASALKLETKGLYASRGRSAYTIIKKEFGLKGSKERVLEQFENLLIEAGIKEPK